MEPPTQLQNRTCAGGSFIALMCNPLRIRSCSLAITVVGLIVLFSCSSQSAQPALASSAAASPTTEPLDLENLQSAFQSVSEKASAAVVAISASSTADDSPASLRTQEMNVDTLQNFLSKTTRVVGAGFFITADGYILTNDHVIDDAQQLWVTTDEKKVYPAIVVGSDPRSDLAVLKIPAHQMPTIQFADAAGLKRGQWSLAIGNPYGLGTQGQMCISVGVVSAINRSLPKLSDKENRSYYNLIQTTAQINPGNSGGPLLNLQGEVIGINTAVVMPQKATSGIGFAIPITDRVRRVISDLRQGKEIAYAYLGVTVAAPTEQQLKDAGVARPTGALVELVQPDSPAAAAQLQPDDLILAVDKQSITGSDDFAQIVSSASISQPVTISLLRAARPMSVRLTLRKRQLPIEPVTRDSQRLRWAGMLLAPVPANHPADESTGLMVLSITPASPFTKIGIHSGSIITSIAGKPITDLIQLQTVLDVTPFAQCELATSPDLASASIQPSN